MESINTSSCFSQTDILLILQIFGLVIMAILFIQSGLDKVTDWKGNLEWLRGHFAKSPFKNTVPLVLGILTFQEVLTGFLCLGGIFAIFMANTSTPAVIGLVLGLTSFVSLFLGQRLAKDYAGAAGLVPYIILNVIVLYLFRLNPIGHGCFLG